MLGRLAAISLAIITVTLLITRSVDAKIITDDHDNILDGYEELMFKDTRDHNEKTVRTNDIGPVGVADEYTNTTAAEIEAKYQDLQEIYHTINEEFNTTNSTAKITELKLDYIQTINELNKLTYIEPKRDYLAEWSKLDAQAVALEELQYSNYTESRQAFIDSLYSQMDEIEQASIASMILDPADEKRLYGIEEKLYNKYGNSSHETFVANDFVEHYVDHAQERVYLIIDQNKALAENSIHPITIVQDVLDSTGIDNLVIDFTEINLLSCRSTTSDCDPLIGGISIGRADSPNDHSGTIGFRAKDSNGNVGFVTAGHVVQYLTSTNTIMHQPRTSNSIIGTIPSNGDDVCSTRYGVDRGEKTRTGQPCDFAFVKLARGVSINDDIYKSPNRVYDINDLAVLSDHVPGTMLKIAGSNGGINTVSIIGGNSSSQAGRVTINTNSNLMGGDSGGPVFKSSTSARNISSAEVYGIVIAQFGYRGLYEPTEKIMSELNLRPYH